MTNSILMILGELLVTAILVYVIYELLVLLSYTPPECTFNQEQALKEQIAEQAALLHASRDVLQLAIESLDQNTDAYVQCSSLHSTLVEYTEREGKQFREVSR